MSAGLGGRSCGLPPPLSCSPSVAWLSFQRHAAPVTQQVGHCASDSANREAHTHIVTLPTTVGDLDFPSNNSDQDRSLDDGDVGPHFRIFVLFIEYLEFVGVFPAY